MSGVTEIHVPYSEIKQEFDETLGYVRQDIQALRREGPKLNYTIGLLICCACDSLSWHTGKKAHEIFTSLLPAEAPYRAVGESLFDALRHGLAHRFRPETNRIGKLKFRFTLSWEERPHLKPISGRTDWIGLNMRVLAEAVIRQIDAYESELRHEGGNEARVAFRKKHERVKPIDDHTPVAEAWKKILGISS